MAFIRCVCDRRAAGGQSHLRTAEGLSAALPGTAPGDLIVPAVICAILSAGLLRSRDVFGAFTEGVGRGLAAMILPPLVLMFTAMGIFRASGALGFFTGLIAPAADFLGFPEEAVLLALIRPVSGSGALAFSGNCWSGPVLTASGAGAPRCLWGALTIAAYFGAAGVKKTG